MSGIFPQKLIEYYSARFRSQKYARAESCLRNGKSVLDVGVWTKFPEPNATENWLEKQTREGVNGKLIAVGLESMADFAHTYSHVFCVQADGSSLPFETGSIDCVISNAVLEHVPCEKQIFFIGELTRVCREWAFFSVPDRYCPLEVHSRILFFHWFPNWRKVFIRLGQLYWSDVKNLSAIFTKKTLKNIIHQSTSTSGKWSINRQMLIIIPISLLALFIPADKKQEHG